MKMRSPTPLGALRAAGRADIQVRQHVVAADLERAVVGGDQLVLALELLADQLLDLRHVHVEQRRQRAHIR